MNNHKMRGNPNSYTNLIHTKNALALQSMESQPQTKLYTYQFQVGDILKVCLASDKKDAMAAFHTKDVNRVNRYIVNSSLALDLFREHTQERSVFDGRSILCFNIK